MTPDSSRDQLSILAGSEGDAWWERNRATLRARKWSMDPVVQALTRNAVIGRQVLEVGCADGGRLNELARRWVCEAVGLEISRAAVEDGRNSFPHLDLHVGSHRDISGTGRFDVIVLGFFLYLVPRGDIFRLVAEVDEHLEEGGHLAIFDFAPPDSRRRPYVHHPGVTTWKTDHARLFEANPQYLTVERCVFPHAEGDTIDDPDHRVSTVLLRKLSPQDAYTEVP